MMNGKEDILWCTELERYVHAPPKDFTGWISQQHPKQTFSSLITGFSASPSTTRMYPTWVVGPDRNCWDGPGVCLWSDTCLPHSRTTLRVNSTCSLYSKYIKHNASIQNQMSSLKEQGPHGDSLISQIQSQLWRDELRGWVEGSWPSDQTVVGRHCGAMRRTSFIDTWSAFVLDVC